MTLRGYAWRAAVGLAAIVVGGAALMAAADGAGSVATKRAWAGLWLLGVAGFHVALWGCRIFGCNLAHAALHVRAHHPWAAAVGRLAAIPLAVGTLLVMARISPRGARGPHTSLVAHHNQGTA